MSRTLRIVPSLVLATFIIGCSSDGEKPSKKTHKPGTPEQALKLLDGKQKQNFERWKSALVKSCDAKAIFAGESDSRMAIDRDELIHRTAGSSLLTDGSSFVGLGSLMPMTGTQETSFSLQSSVGGTSREFKGSTKREGSTCVVSVFGTAVATVNLNESMDVVAAWIPSTKLTLVTNQPSVGSQTGGDWQTVSRSSLMDAAKRVLTSPSANDFQAWIADQLDITVAQASLFRPAYQQNAPIAVRFRPNGESVMSPWSPNGYDTTVLIPSRWSALTTQDGLWTAEIRVPSLASRTMDSTDMSVARFDVSLRQRVVSGKNVEVSVESVSSITKSWGDPDAALECARERAHALRAVQGWSNFDVGTSWADVIRPCESIHPSFERQSFDSMSAGSVVSIMLAGVSPSANTEWRGFGAVLWELLLRANTDDKDIAASLDPSGSTKVVPLIANNESAANEALLALGADSPLRADEPRAAIVSMAFEDALRGDRPESYSPVLQAAEQSWPAFPKSTLTMLDHHGTGVADAYAEREFAQTTASDAAYQTLAKSILAKAEQLGWTAFRRDTFDRVLQRRPSEQDLKRVESRVDTVATHVVKHAAAIASVRESLINMAMTASEAGHLSTDGMVTLFAAIANTATDFPQSTTRLIQDLGQDYAKYAPTLEYAARLTAADKRAATSILALARAASMEDTGREFVDTLLQMQPSSADIARAAASWKSADAFRQRESKRRSKDDEFYDSSSLGDFIEAGVRQYWSDREFTGLESLAALARYYNTCEWTAEKTKSLSRLAACIGVSSFSTDHGRFFDPAYQNRYADSATAFGRMGQQLQGFDFDSTRRAIFNALFGSSTPLWGDKDNATFTADIRRLTDLVNRLVREKDTFKRWEIERQISDLI